MQTKANIGRWAVALTLIAACTGACALSAASGSVLWVENESFGFDACTAAAQAPLGDAAAATMTALRARATADVEAALRAGGVTPDERQYMTLTPTRGTLACGDAQAQVTFRVSAVDRGATKFWSMDLLVRGDSADTDRATIAGLGVELARHFRSGQYTSAKL